MSATCVGAKNKKPEGNLQRFESKAPSAASAGTRALCCPPVAKRGNGRTDGPRTHLPAHILPQKVPPEPRGSLSGHGREVSEHADR